MNVVLWAILSLTAYIFPPGIWSMEWRPRLLEKETSEWRTHCRKATSGKSCSEFVGCCKQFPELSKCAESGGMLEYPMCNYWAGMQFNPDRAECGCFQKFIVADYKGHCQSEEEKKGCEEFAMCCLYADNGRCDQFVAGEVEYPACKYLVGMSFDYNEAICRCSIDSSNETLRANRTRPTFPDVTTSTSPTTVGPTSPTLSTLSSKAYSTRLYLFTVKLAILAMAIVRWYQQ